MTGDDAGPSDCLINKLTEPAVVVVAIRQPWRGSAMERSMAGTDRSTNGADQIRSLLQALDILVMTTRMHRARTDASSSFTFSDYTGGEKGSLSLALSVPAAK